MWKITLIVILIVFVIFYLVNYSKLKEYFTAITNGDELIAKIKEQFRILQTNINVENIQNIPNKSNFIKTETFRELDNLFLKSINTTANKIGLTVNLNRTTYNIYRNSDEIIFDAAIIIQTKEFISGQLFVTVYGKLNNDQLQLLYIMEDTSKLNFSEFNLEQDILNEKSSIEPIDSLMNKEYTSFLNKVEKLNVVDSLPDYKNSFSKFPYRTQFKLNKFIKNTLLQKINNELLSNNRLDTVRDLYNIYVRDVGSDREYIFGFDLLNVDNGITLQLIIYIRIPNIGRFLMKDGDFVPDLEVFMTQDDIIVLRIEKLYQKISIKLTPPNFEGDHSVIDYYRLNNGTSGLNLTEKMKEDYSKKLQGITGFSSLGFCYDSETTYGLTNIDNKENCINNGGIWDYPPEENTNCPFYGGNKNYPNQFGKIVGYSCQLPLNMKLLGNRFYSQNEEYQPLCYNCKSNLIGKGTLGACCEKQKDTNVYPNLITPDYAFEGDTSQRNLYKNILSRNAMSLI